jgi:membrane-bound lytic murein transglycosylase B
LFVRIAFLFGISILISALPGIAAPCGNQGAGFEEWKPVMAQEAAASGVGERGINALMNSSYSNPTIKVDRNQGSMKLSFEQFWKKRYAEDLIGMARKRKAKSPEFYSSLEARYGVPSGVVLAIHGMETSFGAIMGDINVVSAIATLAYDCRRSEFFTDHLISALILVDQGALSTQTVGAAHGEIGHTQFLPGNVLRYGVDGNGDGVVDLTNQTDALASTANFFVQKGWRPGAGYQEGEPNFAVIQQWNASKSYQKAIAIMGSRIDG